MPDNIEILYIIGFSQDIKIEDFGKDYITNLVIENWIPYMECHKFCKTNKI